MITKQQKFIEDNDIVGNSTSDKSKYNSPYYYIIKRFLNLILFIDLEMFLDDPNDQDEVDMDRDNGYPTNDDVYTDQE